MAITSIIEIVFGGTITLILVSTCCYYIVTRTKAKWKHGRVHTAQLDQFEARIAAIETRLSDIQDILLSFDDQLKRLNDRVTAPSQNTTRTLS